MTLNTDSFAFHKAGQDHLHFLEPLWISLYYHHAEVAPQLGDTRSEDESWQIRKQEYQNWFKSDKCFILLTQHETEYIAYAFVRIRAGESATWKVAPKVGELETLSILPEYRGLGLGSMLLERVYEELRHLDVTDLSLGVISTNEEAIRFYERQGFTSKLQYMSKRIS